MWFKGQYVSIQLRSNHCSLAIESGTIENTHTYTHTHTQSTGVYFQSMCELQVTSLLTYRYMFIKIPYAKCLYYTYTLQSNHSDHVVDSISGVFEILYHLTAFAATIE